VCVPYTPTKKEKLMSGGDKFYRKPNRLKDFNYSASAGYFITVCTYNRQRLFCSIINNKIVLTEAGTIAEKYLLSIPIIFTTIELDEYIVMPDHIHFILFNNKNEEENDRTKMLISKVVQQYKFVCTREIKKISGADIKIWQRSFYDRIIRNQSELENIRKYIWLNPMKWEIEKDNPENLYLL
jgi:REP element-mobilizing transposase RayT